MDRSTIFTLPRTERTLAFAYGFMSAFALFTSFLVFNSSSPWSFPDIFAAAPESSGGVSSPSFLTKGASSVYPPETQFRNDSSVDSTSQSSENFAEAPSFMPDGGGSSGEEEAQVGAVSDGNSTDVENRTDASSISAGNGVPDMKTGESAKTGEPAENPGGLSFPAFLTTGAPSVHPSETQIRNASSVHSTNQSVENFDKVPSFMSDGGGSSVKEEAQVGVVSDGNSTDAENQIDASSISAGNGVPDTKTGESAENSGGLSFPALVSGASSAHPPENQTRNASSVHSTNQSLENFDKDPSFMPDGGRSSGEEEAQVGAVSDGNSTESENGVPDTKTEESAKTGESTEQGMAEALLLESLEGCDLFDGEWVMDDSYPLYESSSCSLIDLQFSCIFNGRPDRDFQKYKWKPHGCNLPRMDGGRMLEMLRGKRLVFVGDSLNRNMWESMVCLLKAAAKDQSQVYEAHGNRFFRGKPSFSFIFKDYNCSVEFFLAHFLVREWRVVDKKGSTKDTLRLDLMEKSSDEFKDADFIVFNTGHWWNHDKTSLGKDYFQEGSHVYPNLDVVEAFRKALTTWSRWVDASVDPEKSMVLFRGYSAVHFSGGRWDSGGRCHNNVEPTKNSTSLAGYPEKMVMLEQVLKGMKTPVKYLNVTRMTDYRKDAHPSIYRRPTAKGKRPPMRAQDCSHWCLPGVPDIWNEILYAHVLMDEYRRKAQYSKEE